MIIVIKYSFEIWNNYLEILRTKQTAHFIYIFMHISMILHILPVHNQFTFAVGRANSSTILPDSLPGSVKIAIS